MTTIKKNKLNTFLHLEDRFSLFCVEKKGSAKSINTYEINDLMKQFQEFY